MTTLQTMNPNAGVQPSSALRADVHSARERIEAAVPELPEMKVKLQHMVEAGKEHVTEWKGGLQERISKRPIQSLLIAAAVGTFLGMLIRRRSS